MKLIRSVRVLLLSCTLVIRCTVCFGQIPPTCCPDPEPHTQPDDPSNLTPYIIAAGGLVVAGGTYLYIKKKGPRIPIEEHLSSYLLARNILPNEDALNLMYSLNPSLNGKEQIRENKDLVDPIFPTLPAGKLNRLLEKVNSGAITSIEDLKGQITRLRSNIAMHGKSNMRFNSVDTTLSSRIGASLSSLEKVVLKVEKDIHQATQLVNSLTSDLLSSLNQNLESSLRESEMNESNFEFIQSVLDNLIDISNLNVSTSSIESTSNLDGSYLKQDHALLAFHWQQTTSSEFGYLSDKTVSTISVPPNKASNMLRGFAFAVYSFGENGEPITKGADVEGKYMVKYAMPALKDEINTHRETDGLASFALAMLPPAKFYIVVVDISDGGKVVPLQNPLVDFKVAFRNTGRESINNQEFIIVPIYLAK